MYVCHKKYTKALLKPGVSNAWSVNDPDVDTPLIGKPVHLGILCGRLSCHSALILLSACGHFCQGVVRVSHHEGGHDGTEEGLCRLGLLLCSQSEQKQIEAN